MDIIGHHIAPISPSLHLNAASSPVPKMAPLSPTILRALYKALQSAAKSLTQEQTRCRTLRTRELELLRAAAAAPLPKDLRGLLDLPLLTFHPSPLRPYIAAAARRILEASQAPALAGLEADVGFAALRHLNARVDTLRHLVYETRSAAERHGIRVKAASTYAGSDRAAHYFRYAVRIDNGSQRTVRLVSRAWTIRDLDGGVSVVEGPGVVGRFPRLERGQSYEYSSGVPLATPVGTQSGHYVFVVDGGEVGRKGARTLEVPVAPFSHRRPNLGGGIRVSGRRRKWDEGSRR